MPSPPLKNKPINENAGQPSDKGLGRQILAASLSRLVLNTARRFVYPFAPALSRGLDVPLTAITSLIAVNQFTGFLGLLGGPLADRWGYRRMMLTGLAFLAAGMVAAGVLPYYGVILCGLFLAGLGKTFFDPAVQAFVGDRVSFAHRGRVIGLLEFAWAGSTLVGIPLVGFGVQRMGWRAFFLAMGVAGIIGLVVMARLIPKTDADSRPGAMTASNLRATLRQLVRQRAALGTLGYTFWLSLGNDNLFVVYGVWLENAFQIGLVALGLGTGVIGVAELIGEGLTATLGDRIGLKRAVVVGLLMVSVSYLSLPWLGHHLATALGGLFTVFLCFEFVMVCSISLATELLPNSRATMMAAFFATASLGRVIGAIIGSPLWLAGGLVAITVVSALATVLGLICLLWGLKGWRQAD